MHTADRRWRNFVFLTFALALFGALGAAFSFARWLGWGPTLRSWAQTASSFTFTELFILFVMTVGYVILLTTAFALAGGGGRGWETWFSFRPWSWQRYRPPRHTADS